MFLKVLLILVVTVVLLDVRSCLAREAARKKQWTATAVGMLTCDGRPLPFVRVKLMAQHKGKRGRTMGRARTNERGIFRITGKLRGNRHEKPRPYIQVLFQYSGRYGRMEVENVFGVNRVERSSTQRFRRNMNFGILMITGIACRAYQQFMKALIDYADETNTGLPYPKLHIQTGVRFHTSQPLALTHTIRIPYYQRRITEERAMHQFAHTLRHRLDGDFPHFLQDAVRFKYREEPARDSRWKRSCTKRSNHGLAFNEGWAKYWARAKCQKNIGTSPGDYRYEGNVLNALFALERKCQGSRRMMLEVLRKAGKGAIHGFKRFNHYYQKFYGCSLRDSRNVLDRSVNN